MAAVSLQDLINDVARLRPETLAILRAALDYDAGGFDRETGHAATDAQYQAFEVLEEVAKLGPVEFSPRLDAAVAEHPIVALAAYTSSSQVRNALNTGVLTLAEALEAQDHVKFQTGSWVPGCGGSETPFKFEGQTYLYCWHTRTGEHAYIHLESDRPMPRDWHPGARA